MYFLKSFCCILLFALLPGNVILAQQSYQHEALKAQHEGDSNESGYFQRPRGNL